VSAGMTPHEYAARQILPNLRGLLAWRLRGRGLGQYGIAKLLGVSQPMVHRYLSKDQGYYYTRLLAEVGDEDILDDAVDRAVRLLEAGAEDALWLLVNELTLKSRFCRGREEQCRAVLCPAGSDLHMEVYRAVLEELLSTPCLESVVPEVGSNLAYSPAPRLPRGRIIALNGRILRGSQGVIAAGAPEPGGSRHTAGALEALSRLNQRLRWAVALKLSRPVEEALDRLAIPRVTLEAPSGGGLPPDSTLAAAVEEPAPGREGVVYLAASSAGELLEAVRRISGLACRGEDS